MNNKEFTWHGFTVQITKKNVKRVNMRIKPAKPGLIQMSIPWSVSYDRAVQILEQPRILRWADSYRKRLEEHPVTPSVTGTGEHMQSAPRYRERLTDLLPALFSKWEPLLGVKCGRVTIRDTRSQWGSCNTRNGNISISLWLGAFPEECIEYVVVHELTHLLEPGHNDRFYSILDQHYPSWRQCRKQLKQTH
ncbi:MAG: M48 family metallopeptidase [Clostridiales bacterium]|nr:M48 family metallopeptidase [Clostridiales bacterium]